MNLETQVHYYSYHFKFIIHFTARKNQLTDSYVRTRYDWQLVNITDKPNMLTAKFLAEEIAHLIHALYDNENPFLALS